MNDLISIDSDGLSGAAGQYTLAAQKYAEALTVIFDHLGGVLDVWDDASKAEWSSKLAIVKENLATIATVFETNKKVLSAIAKAATDTETNVKNKITSL